MERIRILIADDHALIRDGLRAVLARMPETEVVGEAATGEDAIAQSEALQPDVILMDIQMPGFNGIEATRHILNASPHVGVIILTVFEDDDLVFAAMRAGARGYVLKEAEDDVVLRAVRAVANGEANFSPSIAVRLITFFRNLGASPALSKGSIFPELTEREREVLELIAQGRGNEDIARMLNLSVKTVRNHTSNIFNKLQVATRAQAIVRAREAGLGK